MATTPCCGYSNAYYLLESPTPRWAARRVILPEGDEYNFTRVSANLTLTRHALSLAASERPKFLCLNDEIAGDGEGSADIFHEVREFLAASYPLASPFERATPLEKPSS